MAIRHGYDAETIQYAGYAAIFLDMMGQRELYKLIENEIPPEEMKVERAEYIVAVKKFLETTRALSSIPQLFIDGIAGRAPWHEQQEEQASHAKVESDCKIQRFSDGMIVYVRLDENSDVHPAISIYVALHSISSVMMYLLGKEQPLRGGMALGFGAEAYPNELYGPVIGRAYKLESEHAFWPRLVIGKEVVSYLLDCQNYKSNNAEREARVHACSRSSLEIIRKDVDGLYMLDFLKMEYLDSDKALELIEDIEKFVAKMERKFYENESKSGLALRYTLLLNYIHQSKVPLNSKANSAWE